MLAAVDRCGKQTQKCRSVSNFRSLALPWPTERERELILFREQSPKSSLLCKEMSKQSSFNVFSRNEIAYKCALCFFVCRPRLCHKDLRGPAAELIMGNERKADKASKLTHFQMFETTRKAHATCLHLIVLPTRSKKKLNEKQQGDCGINKINVNRFLQTYIFVQWRMSYSTYYFFIFDK